MSDSKYSKLPEKRKDSLRKANVKYVEKTYAQVHLNLKKDVHKKWVEEAHKHGFKDLAPFVRWCVEKVIASGVDDSD